MARSLRDDEIARHNWMDLKVQCPICKNTFDSWYCPNCGLPKNNSAYGIYKENIYHCGPNHFRREIGTVSEYQMCGKCHTPNPYNAKFCRSCGENITKQAIDKNGHSWVDLGLSVLWSTESLSHRFLWNDTTITYENQDYEESRKIRDLYKKSNYGEIGGKDAATHYWGEKWRTPTKEDFDELITKCKWEKYIIPITNQFALKAIGPNGNSIIFPMNNLLKDSNYGISLWSYGISLWSSTKENNILTAYAFHFHEEVEFESTLTAKQKKRWEFIESNNIRFKVDLSHEESWSSFYRGIRDYGKRIEEKRRKVFPQYEKTLEQQRKILDAMGDDSHEREANEKADLKRWHHLWLTSPIKITISADPANDIANGTMSLKLRHKTASLGIRPVADKKWQGKL